MCEVISVDEKLTETMVVIKRNLLQKIKVKEFSVEAQFKEPALEMIVPQVTCQACLVSHNVDLLRTYKSDINGWECEACHVPYSTQSLEQRLIQILKRRLIST